LEAKLKSLLLLTFIFLVSCGGGLGEDEQTNIIRKKQPLENFGSKDGIYFTIKSLKQNDDARFIVLACKEVSGITNQRKVNDLIDLLDFLQDNDSLIKIEEIILGKYSEEKMIWQAIRQLKKEIQLDPKSEKCPKQILAKHIDYKKPKIKK
jgi:hypothetical protein